MAKRGETGRQAAYKKRKPWVRLLEFARRRCNDQDPESKNYAHYFEKGIECHLTLGELEVIWKRDNAHLLTRPSLDRKDANEHYTYENCRVVEWLINVQLPHGGPNPFAEDSMAEFT